MAKIGTLTADLRLRSAAFVRDMTRAAQAVNTNTAKMRRSMRQVEVAGRNLSRQFNQIRLGVGALAAGAGVNKLREQFAGFEAALQRTVGLVGVAQGQVNAFNAEILKMAPAVGKGPNELAEALFFITSAGLRGERALQALNVSARASTAGLGETKVVADAVTSAMNAYARSGLTASQATDVLVATVREGKLEASQLAGSIGQVLAVAENAGVRFDEVGATVAALTRIGIPAAESITGLRSVLVALLKETETGKAALQTFGTSFADLRRQIREDGLIKTLTDLKETVAGNATALTDIFGRVEATNTVLALTGGNAAQVQGIFERMAQSTGALDDAFRAVAGTAEFQFNAALAKLSVEGIRLGANVVPGMARALGFLADNIRTVTTALAALIALKATGMMLALAQSVAKFTLAMVTAARATSLVDALLTRTVLGAVAKLAITLGAAALTWEAFGKEAMGSATAIEESTRRIMQSLGGLSDAAGGEGPSTAVTSTIQALQVEQQQLTALRQAYDQGAKAIENINDARDVQNKLISLGLSIKDEEGRQVAQLIVANNELKRSIEAVKTRQQEFARIAENAFDRVGGAITEAFVQGKAAAVDFGSIVQGVLSEIMQAALRLAVVNPILNSLFGGNRATIGGGGVSSTGGGLLGSVFGGGGARQFSFFENLFPSPSMVSGSFHAGGVVGSTPVRQRVTPAGLFAGAPRLHSGLMPGEFPAILERGERVIPKGGGAGGDVSVTVINNSGASGRVREQRTAGGGRDIRVIIGEELAEDVRRGGPLGSAIGNTFGLKRKTVGR